ncbi:transcriptional regulator [Salipiger aestuarii]|nr:transcriptional regulator [Salipiger aestuarii]KAA8606697.1 transcriptional regulator [Salipiger aestuarii]KAB2533481.1 transcriptional regulator [Salipiger aestuarii]
MPSAETDPRTFKQPPKKARLTRGEKSQQTYRNLMDAAAKIVGETGYAATSIAKVTEAAGVAHGTFYNYFKDRQALFDVLLPYVGEQMTDQITEDLADAGNGIEREIARFRAYCDYLKSTPGFYRVLYEAEVFAPAAHEAHIQRLSDGYHRALKRAMDAGHLRRMSDDELAATVAILLGARAYVAMQHKNTGKVPESAVQAYADLMRHGLFL